VTAKHLEAIKIGHIHVQVDVHLLALILVILKQIAQLALEYAWTCIIDLFDKLFLWRVLLLFAEGLEHPVVIGLIFVNLTQHLWDVRRKLAVPGW
jgi:hypothetical protein